MDDELPDGLFRTKLIPPSQAFDPPLCLPRRIVVLNSEQHPHPQHIHPLRPPLQDPTIINHPLGIPKIQRRCREEL